MDDGILQSNESEQTTAEHKDGFHKHHVEQTSEKCILQYKNITVGGGLKAVCQCTIPQSRKALHSHLYSSVI